MINWSAAVNGVTVMSGWAVIICVGWDDSEGGRCDDERVRESKRERVRESKRESEREGERVRERERERERDKYMERESKRKADWERERLGTSIRRQNKPSEDELQKSNRNYLTNCTAVQGLNSFCCEQIITYDHFTT